MTTEKEPVKTWVRFHDLDYAACWWLVNDHALNFEVVQYYA